MIDQNESIKVMQDLSEEMLIKFCNSVENSLHGKSQAEVRLIISSYTAFLMRAVDALGSLLPDPMIRDYFEYLSSTMIELYQLRKQIRKEENGN